MGREKKAKTKFKKVVSEQFPVNPKRGGGILKIEAWENEKGEIVKYGIAYILEFSKNSWSEKQGLGMIFAAGILKVV